MTNLVLTDVDQAVLGRGFPIIRYADDIAIAAASRDEAWEAVRCVAAAVEELGMTLGPEDTHVMSFEEGFCFLGEDFGPRYPPWVGPRVAEDDRKVLYAGLQGGRVRIDHGRVVVESADDTEVLDVASGHVARVVCFGSVGFSAGARSWAFANDVDVVFASRSGTYQGVLLGGRSGPRIDRLRIQLDLTRTAAVMPICRAIVEAKIKQIVVLQRFA